MKRLDNGTYVVKSKKDAVAAVQMMRELRDEIEELMEEHGIREMMQDSAAVKIAAENWCIANNAKKLDLGEGVYATLVEQHYDSHYVGTKDDVTGQEGRVITPLRTIIFKKFKSAKAKEIWRRATRRDTMQHGAA